MQKLFRSLIAVGVLGGLAACGDDVSVTPPPDPVAIAVTGIAVSPPSASVAVGGKVQLSASVQTNGGTGTIDLGVNWSTSSATVATVDAAGLVTAVGSGAATITATSKADANQKAGAQITVTSGVQSVSVTPQAYSLTVGQTATPSATVTRDAGVAGTVTWTSNNATVASVNGTTGVITANAIGNAVITATSTVDASKSASLNVSVGASANALTSLSVTPQNVNLGPGGTQAIVTNTTTASPATGTVNVTFANSANSANCTVTPTGANPTITAVSNGTCVVTISATGTPSASGSGLQANTLSQTVTVNIQAAAVSIEGLTTCAGPAPCTVIPVNLAGVAGQIEATLNISSGNQVIDSVVVRINGIHAASQVFGVNGAPQAPITLSINTARFNPTTFVPDFINGAAQIRAEIYPHGAASPTASNTVLFTLTNADVIYFNATVGTTAGGPGLNHTGISAVGAGGFTWWKSGFTYRGNPVLYSGAANVVSIKYTSSLCGSNTGAGPNFAATFGCAAVEGAQNITNNPGDVAITYVASYTLTTSPNQMMTAASAGYVPGSPVFSVVTTREDNKAPTYVLSNVAFNDAFDQFWINASYAIAQDFTISDGGVGVNNAATVYRLWVQGAPGSCSGTAITTGNDLAETLVSDGSPDGYQDCATAQDLLANASASGASNWFGVDKGAPSVRLAGSTGATPSIAPSTVASVSSVANTTIYGDGAGPLSGTFPVMPATDVWGLEGIDSRSGFNQNAVANFPSQQSLSRLAVSGPTSCASFTAPLNQVLSDNWVRVAVLVTLDCGGQGIGYYAYNGKVVDRAGNASTQIVRNFAQDHLLAPTLSSIGVATVFYTAGQPASFFLFGSDDLEIIEGDLSVS